MTVKADTLNSSLQNFQGVNMRRNDIYRKPWVGSTCAGMTSD
jgi:hypothetical protein